MSTLSIVLRKDKVNKLGECPIHFRIIKDRKVSYVSSTQKVQLNQWDEKNKRVKSNHPNSARLNNFINQRFAELSGKTLELETTNKQVSNKQLKAFVIGTAPISFFDFASEILISYFNKGKIGTHSKCSSIIKKLKVYTGGKDLYFSDINSGFIFKYENYLRTELNNKTNTIHKDLKFLKTIFSKAYNLDIIDNDKNPFNKYQIKTEKTNRIFLSENEINLIESYPTIANSRMELHKDMFIFCCYAGGIRISDVLKLQWENFDGTHLNIQTKKTLEQINLKLPNKALTILNKYKYDIQYPTDFIFPMFKNNLNLNDAIALDKATSSANAYINKNLKIICQNVGITKNVSFHTSRHTWATLALTKGIPLEHVSKLMAHSNITQTQTYAKLINSALDKSMDAFN